MKKLRSLKMKKFDYTSYRLFYSHVDAWKWNVFQKWLKDAS